MRCTPGATSCAPGRSQVCRAASIGSASTASDIPARYASTRTRRRTTRAEAHPRSTSRLADMCGIVGYVGSRSALDVVVEGLRRLEYRGYDSAGVAVIDGD